MAYDSASEGFVVFDARDVVSDGSILDVRVRAIRSIGTSAANLVGLAL